MGFKRRKEPNEMTEKSNLRSGHSVRLAKPPAVRILSFVEPRYC